MIDIYLKLFNLIFIHLYYIITRLISISPVLVYPDTEKFYNAPHCQLTIEVQCWLLHSIIRRLEFNYVF